MSSLKRSLADSLASNYKLNKKALHMKKSWDEVAKLIQADKPAKKKKAK